MRIAHILRQEHSQQSGKTRSDVESDVSMRRRLCPPRRPLCEPSPNAPGSRGHREGAVGTEGAGRAGVTQGSLDVGSGDGRFGGGEEAAELI